MDMESDSENEGEGTMTMRGLRIINSQSNPIDLDNYMRLLAVQVALQFGSQNN